MAKITYQEAADILDSAYAVIVLMSRSELDRTSFTPQTDAVIRYSIRGIQTEVLRATYGAQNGLN